MIIEIHSDYGDNEKLKFNVDEGDEMVHIGINDGKEEYSVSVSFTELVAAVEAIKHLIKK